MYEALYRYLIKYKKLDLPGIGALALQITPAGAEFVNHTFTPPKYSFSFLRSDDVPPEKLFSWLAASLTVTEQEAVIRFNEFLYELNRQLREGKQIDWQQVGSLHKEFSGEIQFSPQQKWLPGAQPLSAEKVSRQNVEHTMLVGEKEQTSSQMRERLHPVEAEKADYWWVWPLAAIIGALLCVGLHFSESNSGNATGNTLHISPQDAPSGYPLSAQFPGN